MPVSPGSFITFSVSRTNHRRRGMLRAGASFGLLARDRGKIGRMGLKPLEADAAGRTRRPWPGRIWN